jgi:tetratricopeptide (TPR) repeat protein
MNAIASETMLDAEELQHLALKAMEADQNDAAISFLKRALTLAPEDGELYYMLGAVHAEIGMHKRAAEEIAHGLTLAPNLHPASFQLGLLHLTNGDFEQAKLAWQPLSQLESDHPLRVFAQGLTHLGNDEFKECIEELQRGIAVCGNDTLNNDMRRVIQEAQTALAAQGSEAQAAVTPTGRAAASKLQHNNSQHVLLAGYQRPQSDAAKP